MGESRARGCLTRTSQARLSPSACLLQLHLHPLLLKAHTGQSLRHLVFSSPVYPATQSPWWPRPNLSAILAVGTYPTYTALYLSFIKPNHNDTGCILPLSLNPHPVQTYLIVNRNLKHSPRFVVLLPQAPLGHRMMTPNTTTSHSMTSCSIYPSSRTGVHSI